MGIFSNNDGRERWHRLAELVTNGLRNFQVLGRSLKEIRDEELYKFEFATFEDCCRVKWKISTQHAVRLINAYDTAAEISPMGEVALTERQIRPLTTLPKEQQREAWTEAQESGGTAEAVAAAVAKRRRKNSRKPKLARPIKLRCAGGTVTITPNRKFSSAALTLTHALQQVSEQREAA